jgi:hypothetical protein
MLYRHLKLIEEDFHVGFVHDLYLIREVRFLKGEVIGEGELREFCDRMAAFVLNTLIFVLFIIYLNI